MQDQARALYRSAAGHAPGSADEVSMKGAQVAGNAHKLMGSRDLVVRELGARARADLGEQMAAGAL